MSTRLADNSPPSSVVHARRRSSPIAIAATGVALTGYGAYGCAALVRIGALDDRVRLVAGLSALAVLWLAAQRKPFAITFALLTILPLFGNHPGGRYMECVNLPLAASAAGLIAVARRGQHPAPDGPIWRMALLYLLAAIIAVVPTLPWLAVRAVQINNPMLFVTEALTAPEDDALYSISSLVLLALAVTWAFALSWAGTAHRFTLKTYRVLTIGLFAATAIGIADCFGSHPLVAGTYDSSTLDRSTSSGCSRSSGIRAGLAGTSRWCSGWRLGCGRSHLAAGGWRWVSNYCCVISLSS